MDRIGEGDEQVTIVRIAIEDILEKVIDPQALEPVSESVCVCAQITCRCGYTCSSRERCPLVRPPPWRARAFAARDCTMFETTLWIDIRYQRGWSRTGNVSAALRARGE